MNMRIAPGDGGWVGYGVVVIVPVTTAVASLTFLARSWHLVAKIAVALLAAWLVLPLAGLLALAVGESP
jgi:hypothetical protein